MSELIDRVKNKQINRRNFLKVTAASTASLALAGCGSTLATVPDARGKQADLKNGKWVTVSCTTQGCAGRCLNRGYVVDGIVVRQKTDDTHEDSPDYPQLRGCPKGRASRQLYLGADRLKYPLKRKNWEPGGGKKELRGRDEWVRISWDEATDIVASELKRIAGIYGNKSILTTNLVDARSLGGLYTASLLNAMGGCTTTWGQQSQGGFPLVANKMKGDWSLGIMDNSDRLSIRKAKLIILWGNNNAHSLYGNNAYHYIQAKKAGAKIIMIDPWLSPTAQAIADQWVPVRPGTDGALLLALAHHMITNNLQDQAFLDQYTLGFDAEHLPEGVDPKDNFKDYVLGTYDGTPKTPEWASKICGTSADVIRKLAQEMATTKPMTMKSSFAPARTHGGAQYVQLFFTVGWMTGNVGLPGAEIGAGAACVQGAFGGAPLVQFGPSKLNLLPNPICTWPRGGGALGKGVYDPNQYYGVANAELWSSIIDGEYTDFIHGKKPIDIRCIYAIGPGAALNQTFGANLGHEAYRKVEFAVSSDMFMTTNALFSDIVLPACSTWEAPWGDGLNRMGAVGGNREYVIFGDQVMEPMFEAHTDMWIEEEIGKKLGIDPKVLHPISQEQASFNRINGATVMKEDGSGFEPLVEITAADLKEVGLAGTPQPGRITLKEFREKGVYQFKRTPDDKFAYIVNQKFRQDPVANPVKTESGKLEIYCRSLAEAASKFNSTPIEAVPKYRKALEGYEETFSDWDKQVKGEYPYQLVTLHHIRQAHSMFYNVKVLNELFANNLVVNTKDAEKLGLQNEETVLVSSRHGKILRRLSITPYIMPGVVLLGMGNWTDLDQDGIDKGGNTNLLCGATLVGEGHQPYNSCLVKIDKWTGTPLEPDYLKPQRIIKEG